MELTIGASYNLQYRIGRSIFEIEDGFVRSLDEGDYLVEGTSPGRHNALIDEWRVPPASIVAAEELA